MDKTIGYILKNLGNTEEALNSVVKVLRRQKKINRNLIILMFLLSVHTMTTDRELKKVRQKLRDSSNEEN
ncbi:MAG: hypothetical protein LIO96_07970 [Lachnospiraceae bacterium]|nr:hypothetical protein [Lachnospiraceae bacterium]